MSSFVYCIIFGLIAYAAGSGLQRVCDDSNCPYGERCILETVYCIRAPCPPLQRCVPAEKPGTCPQQTDIGTSDVRCFDDNSCPGTQKCCGNRLKVCVEPIPEVQQTSRCPPRPLGLFGSWCRIIRSDCESHEDCDQGYLCCDSGCGHRCTSPLVEIEQGPN
ncbi:perlwapin-like [Liolophura sinensis]|uniref:perlwapin-like n=1 Tax=Liolophura sinensis TaxID=3198878 RepID=UPI003158C5CA